MELANLCEKLKKIKTLKMKIRMEKRSRNGGKERVQGQGVLAGL